MYSKSIFIFLIVGLLLLTKINGEDINNYTGKCKNIYEYLESQGKAANLQNCNVNKKGEVTGLYIYLHCLTNEQLKTILSYKTIKDLSLYTITNLEYYSDDIISDYGCIDTPTNYEIISTLTNLETLYLEGESNDNLYSNIPKSIELLQIDSLNLNQKMVDAFSKLTNLNELFMRDTEFSKDLDFSKFTNLKKLTDISLHYYSSPYIGNLFKYCKYVKSLNTYLVTFDEDTINTIGYLTNLEELTLGNSGFEDNVSFSSIKNLKNLTYLDISCGSSNYHNKFSPNFFYLTKLKSFTLMNCGSKFSVAEDQSLTWANFKNLEYLQITDEDNYTMDDKKEIFDLSYLGDLTKLVEVFISNTGYSSIPESIGNLKNLEILNIPRNSIDSLPKSIGKLKKLRELIMYYNNLTSLPDEIGNLKNLEILDFRLNNINDIPETIGNLVNLRELSGGFNNITTIPTSIGNLTNLEELSFDNNKIVEIPKSIGNLINVTKLLFESNNIEVLPDVFGNMKNLDWIDFSYNKITSIPPSLESLKIDYEFI